MRDRKVREERQRRKVEKGTESEKKERERNQLMIAVEHMVEKMK